MKNPDDMDKLMSVFLENLDEEARKKTELNYEYTRKKYFNKYPALKQAWEEYKITEKLYIGKG